MTKGKGAAPRGAAARVLKRLAAKKSEPKKKARTLYLHSENFDRFRDACEQQDFVPSEVIDEFILEFLEGLDSPGA